MEPAQTYMGWCSDEAAPASHAWVASAAFAAAGASPSRRHCMVFSTPNT